MITLPFWMKRIFAITSVLLFIPFFAMQFTSEVNWGILDFIVMGGLLLFFGFTFDLLIRKVFKLNLKVLLGIGVIIIFLLIWAELAVGIFETPFAGS